ncbi:MAG: carbon storage regulator CsrA [Actinomycetota bacterium]
MLVLSRRKGESVIIGDNVTITVVDVRGDQIRLGIDAPRSVKVYREEVYRQVVAENEAASRSVDAASQMLRRARPRPRNDS